LLKTPLFMPFFNGHASVIMDANKTPRPPTRTVIDRRAGAAAQTGTDVKNLVISAIF
jgi:hypothetical protein